MDWSKFSFEYRYKWEKLFVALVNIEAYKQSALNLVLPPDWKEKLDRLNRVRALYGTTALEGNPLSESEVSHQMDIVDGNAKGATDKATREQLQIRNSVIAQSWVKERFKPGSRPLRTEDILEMHQIVTRHSDTKDNVPGRLRTFSVVVGSPDMGGVHKGAPFEELPRLMEEYVNFINSPKALAEGPVVRALLAHFFS